MEIKKLISTLLTFVIVISSKGNCSAMFSNSGYDSEDSLSDIVLPDRDPYCGDLDTDIADVERNTQKLQQLREQLRRSDAEIIELRTIYARNKGELDRINQMLCDAIRERDIARIQVDEAHKELKKWTDDVLCTDCICFRNPVDEARSFISGDVNRIPSSFILRSKRFYKGMVTGIVIVLVVLVGTYVCVHYMRLPASSQ